MANLHPSKDAHEFLEDVLARRTGVRRNIWARIAVARSLALDDLPADSSKYDSEGTELARHTILGDYDPLFRAMLTFRHQRPISDEEFFPKLFKLHLERGVRLLREEWQLCGGRPEDFYIKLAENLPALGGLGAQIICEGVKDLIKLEVGTIEESNQKLFWELNKSNNPHLCVVGTTGSGKTQLVKELLAQLCEHTANRLPFIFFDYARGDVAGDRDFVQATGARVVNLPTQPVPLSPLRPCHSDIEVSQQAHHLAKIFREVAPHVGVVQEQRLISAVRECYLREGRPPNFPEIRSELGDAIDSLSAVFAKLTDLHLFPEQSDDALEIQELLKHSWIIDLHGLQELRDLVVFLTLDALRYYFGLLGDQKVSPGTGVKEMRCILVIDEAHNFLPRDSAQVLEKCLRELRGKGVGVWLLTQNPRDLDQSDYNYGSEVNFHVCLKVLDAHPQTLSNLYGVPMNDAKAWSAKLATFEGEGILRNIAAPRGFSKVSIKQFKDRAIR